MFRIKSLHAEQYADKEGRTAVKLILNTEILPMQRERIIPASIFTGEEEINQAIDAVNHRVSPAIEGCMVYWILDLQPLFEKIEAADKEFFTEYPLGMAVFKKVSSLLKEMYNISFLLQ